jgi:hypothetical protein
MVIVGDVLISQSAGLFGSPPAFSALTTILYEPYATGESTTGPGRARGGSRRLSL